MPITFRLYPLKKIMISTWIGEITDDMIIEEYTKALSLGLWRADYNHIANLLYADESKITGDGLRRLFKFNQEQYGFDSDIISKTVVISQKESIAYLTRIYNELLVGSTRSIKFFYNVHDALNWMKE